MKLFSTGVVGIKFGGFSFVLWGGFWCGYEWCEQQDKKWKMWNVGNYDVFMWIVIVLWWKFGVKRCYYA